jgi:hypothetical protein
MKPLPYSAEELKTVRHYSEMYPDEKCVPHRLLATIGAVELENKMLRQELERAVQLVEARCPPDRGLNCHWTSIGCVAHRQRYLRGIEGPLEDEEEATDGKH